MSVTPSTLLSLPVIGTGTESGTWGNYVNNGLTSYLDNVIAGTVTLTNDGAVTLANTAGDNAGTNIVSSLTGAGSVSAQFSVINVTGTLTTAKVLTAPSSSRQYIVVNSATGSTVTIKASGQSGVSVAVGETATVYFNGTDYVKSATTTFGTGTVTAVSVASANGFAGTSSGGATPALTLTTSITGVLKGNGTAISAATAGTDYVAPGGALGTPSSGTVTNLTGTASININGTVGATTPASGGFTTLSANSTVSGTGFSTYLASPPAIGTTSAAAGNFTNSQITSLGVGTAASGTTGEIRATNNITAYYSDDRLKKRLGSVENALDKVRTLDSFYYEANETAQELGYEPIREVGISAQQVQAVLPEVVVPAPIDDKYLTVRYERLVPLLIAAIKELEAKVKVLEAK